MKYIIFIIAVLILNTCSIFNSFIEFGDIPEYWGGKYGYGFTLHEFDLHFPAPPERKIVFIPVKYKDVFDNWEYSIPVHIVASMARVESRWDNTAVSKRNSNGSRDLGLMQLNSHYIDYFVNKYWDKQESFDPFNGNHSLYIAVNHLEWLMDRLDGDVNKVIQAYNVGLTAVRRGHNRASAERYLQRVLGELHGQSVR